VLQYLADDGRIFDGGDDLYLAAATLADRNVDVEFPLEALCP